MKAHVRFFHLNPIPLLVLAICPWFPLLGQTGNNSSDSNDPFKLCYGTYALCMAATCIPIPTPAGASSKQQYALCECQVEFGASIGNADCKSRIPSGPGQQFITSTYGWANIAQPLMTCPGGTARTNCFNQPCIIDKNDPTKAWCTCPISDEKEPFMTRGGNCDTSTCENILYQGGTASQIHGANQQLSQLTGIPTPDQNRCDQ